MGGVHGCACATVIMASVAPPHTPPHTPCVLISLTPEAIFVRPMSNTGEGDVQPKQITFYNNIWRGRTLQCILCRHWVAEPWPQSRVAGCWLALGEADVSTGDRPAAKPAKHHCC